jgi:hypothetical protein
MFFPGYPREKATKKKGLQGVLKKSLFCSWEEAGAFRPLNTGHKGGPLGPGFLFCRHNRTVSAPSSAQAFPSPKVSPQTRHSDRSAAESRNPLFAWTGDHPTRRNKN